MIDAIVSNLGIIVYLALVTVFAFLLGGVIR